MPYIHNEFSDPNLTEIGRLQIGTLAVSAGKPAMGATVRVTQRGEPGNVIEEMVSDTSGRTPTINLPAPPIDYSMQLTDVRPYSEYDVSVVMDGFERAYVEGVQILPDTTSYQDVNLSPVTGNPDQSEVITIKDHSLWGDFPPKIPEMDTKPLPPATGLVVLPEPVVPEYVIVHAGKPADASAPNHWVSFRD